MKGGSRHGGDNIQPGPRGPRHCLGRQACCPPSSGAAGGGEAGNLHRLAGKEGYQLLVLVLNIGPGHRWALRMQGEQGREVGAQIIVQR